MDPATAPRSQHAWHAIAVLGAALAAARYLHGLADAPWARIDLGAPAAWLGTTPLEDVVAALLRLGAVVLCWWAVGTLVVAIGTRLVGWRPAVALADLLSPRALRRVADGLAGASLVVTTALGPAVPALAADPAGAPVPAATSPFAPPGVTAPIDAGPGVVDGPDPHPDAAATGDLVEVRPGDHLWSIAQRTVAARRGVPVDAIAAAEVAPYWRRLVEANRGRLASGDPDLVLPGETVLLPEWRP